MGVTNSKYRLGHIDYDSYNYDWPLTAFQSSLSERRRKNWDLYVKYLTWDMIANSLNQSKFWQDCPKFEICRHCLSIPFYIISDRFINLFPRSLFNKCSLNTFDVLGIF